MSDQPSVQSGASALFDYALYQRGSVLEIELWPRSGTWSPFLVVVPAGERALLNSVSASPRNYRTVDTRIIRKVDVDAGSHSGFGLHETITPDISARVFLGGTPSEVQFGEVGKPLHVLRFDDA